MFFPPHVEEIYSISPFPFISIQFAIPLNLRSTFLISLTNSDLDGDIARLAPKSITTKNMMNQNWKHHQRVMVYLFCQGIVCSGRRNKLSYGRKSIISADTEYKGIIQKKTEVYSVSKN